MLTRIILWQEYKNKSSISIVSKTFSMYTPISYVQGASKPVCLMFSKCDLRVAHIPSMLMKRWKM